MASLPVDPRTGLPIAPGVPAGWSLDPNGVPIDQAGIAHPEMVAGSSSLFPPDFPTTSVAVGAGAGYFLGKDKNKGGL